MKKTRLAAILALVLMLTAMLSGCADADKGADSASPGAKDDGLECNWLLKVDQTIPVKEGDLTVNHTLVLIARKEGGKDVYGTYEGAAYIGSHLDISELSKMFIKLAGGFDVDAFANNLSFEIQPFDKQRYAAYGSEDKASLLPLVEYESMALLSPEMKGGVIINPTVKSSDGFQGGYNQSGIGEGPVAMKIAIHSGKVHVNVPSVVDESFEGMITGDPKISDEEYQQAMKRIEELMKGQDEKTTEQESEDSTMMGNFADLNQTPWPDELVPNIPKAGDKFSPNVLLNREQAATMLTRVFKRVSIAGWTLQTDSQFTLPYTKPAAFADDAKISDWAKDSVYFMVANDIIKGTGNNMFSPRATTPAEEAANYATATREQALVIAVRMVENLK